MRSLVWCAVLSLVCLSPAPADPQPAQKAPPPTMVELPGFPVEIALSPKARQKLVSARETVIVAVYLYANPKKSVPAKFVDEMGQVNLGEARTEVAPGENATLLPFHVKKLALDRVDDDGVQVNLNVFSGRKSSPDNLVDCGIWEGPLKDAATAKIHIACKLIGE